MSLEVVLVVELVVSVTGTIVMTVGVVRALFVVVIVVEEDEEEDEVAAGVSFDNGGNVSVWPWLLLTTHPVFPPDTAMQTLLSGQHKFCVLQSTGAMEGHVLPS